MLEEEAGEEGRPRQEVTPRSRKINGPLATMRPSGDKSA